MPSLIAWPRERRRHLAGRSTENIARYHKTCEIALQKPQAPNTMSIDLPDPHDTIATTGGELSSIGTESHSMHGDFVSDER